MSSADSQFVWLPRSENQARGIGQYACDFLNDRWPDPDAAVFDRTEQFHRDSVACAVAAIALRLNAVEVLRAEAAEYPQASGAVCFGTRDRVAPEKAALANVAAVRELDANGTNFGFNPRTGDRRGEFGHNDFYPVVVAAARRCGWDGRRTLKAMICLDEIRGRLAEVFALRDHKIDHVLHGGIAVAAVYGAALGATPQQIESAIGLLVAHHVPFRAIRAGHQLSDSKGASAAITSEAAMQAVHRSLRGFIGPADIFRNPQALFCLFEPSPRPHESPFDLRLATHGDDFAVLGMHFKLGLYEHQSAGAIHGLLEVLSGDPTLLADPRQIRLLRITIYEPAYSIIGDPAKRDPQTRQSADHSMVYIIATLLRKAFAAGRVGWRELMLLPADYDADALFDPVTRDWMQRIAFVHGGPEYDQHYPEGIPTSVELECADGRRLSSGLVKFPLGHARNTAAPFAEVLDYKFTRLVELGVDDPTALGSRLSDLAGKSAAEIAELYEFPLCVRTK